MKKKQEKEEDDGQEEHSEKVRSTTRRWGTQLGEV